MSHHDAVILSLCLSAHAGWRENDLSLGRVVATLSVARRILREN